MIITISDQQRKIVRYILFKLRALFQVNTLLGTIQIGRQDFINNHKTGERFLMECYLAVNLPQ